MLISKEANHFNQPKYPNISIGETVRVTSSGLVGRVVSIKNNNVSIRLDEGSVIVCHVNHVTPKQVLMEG